MRIVDEYDGLENIIISSNETDEVSIKDIGLEIAKNFDYLNNVEFDTSFSDGQYKKTVSNERLRRLFGPLKFTDIKSGDKLVEWFIKIIEKLENDINDEILINNYINDIYIYINDI